MAEILRHLGKAGCPCIAVCSGQLVPVPEQRFTQGVCIKYRDAVPITVRVIVHAAIGAAHISRPCEQLFRRMQAALVAVGLPLGHQRQNRIGTATMYPHTGRAEQPAVQPGIACIVQLIFQHRVAPAAQQSFVHGSALQINTNRAAVGAGNLDCIAFARGKGLNYETAAFIGIRRAGVESIHQNMRNRNCIFLWL